MDKYQIGVIVGSLRKDSFNRKLAKGIEKLMPSEFVCQYIEIGDLPLYNQDDDSNPSVQTERLKSEISAMHGILFATPEYNRSIPGVLKNALDHASRPYGQNAFAGKPAGVLGVSIGATGTALSQQHLRNVLAYLDMPTLCQPEAFIQMKDGLFDQAGNIGEASKAFLQKWVDEFVVWVKKHADSSK